MRSQPNLKTKRIGKNNMAFVIVAMKKVSHGSSPRDIPSGMPPLNSLMGLMVTNTTRAILYVT